ncbi:hypothetical protein ABZP36_030006 [Zizania latifolia]
MEGGKVNAAAYGFPAPVRPGRPRGEVDRNRRHGCGAVAARLLNAGFAVTTYARTPAKAETLVAAGASLADSPAAVSAGSDVVFTMVGNPSDVRAVVVDAASGDLAGLRPGGVLVVLWRVSLLGVLCPSSPSDSSTKRQDQMQMASILQCNQRANITYFQQQFEFVKYFTLN